MNTARAPEEAKIGWIGLGKMGLPICERLAAHVFPLTALTAAQSVANGAPGLEFAAHPAVDGAGIVVSAISDDAALRAEEVFARTRRSDARGGKTRWPGL